ncbi:MAG: hypothetical protein E3J72_13200 [Planctomycetota bacterium]|nr:MAG: hypothetical protein E3J72_13200 [Planctomycetota bacterium]
MIIWGGTTYIDTGWTGPTNTGGMYDPVADTWTNISTIGDCPSVRTAHISVWTGNSMIIWGGSDDNSSLNTGGIFDPIQNTWTPTSTGNGCPVARYAPHAFWTNNKMIIWGGLNYSGVALNNGGMYDPIADSWETIDVSPDSPSLRMGSSAVWTGSTMIVWGGIEMFDNGASSQRINSGGIFDPVAKSWTATSLAGQYPGGNVLHSATWTGEEMYIWGGGGVASFSNHLYNPESDSWRKAIPGRYYHNGIGYHKEVWTGSSVVIWGGREGSGILLNSGHIYYPDKNYWVYTSKSKDCPSGRWFHTAVWTGNEMIVWGGEDEGGRFLNTGGIFMP